MWFSAANSAVLSVAGVSALMALQGVEDATERRRRAIRRGGGLLDRLDEELEAVRETLTRLQQDDDGIPVWTEEKQYRPVPVPDDLANPAPVPPPFDLFSTTYDWLHATGIDRAPYTRLADAFRRRILGEPIAPHEPRPATFEDGVAGQAVLDAIRRSAAEGRSVRVTD